MLRSEEKEPTTLLIRNPISIEVPKFLYIYNIEIVFEVSDQLPLEKNQGK